MMRAKQLLKRTRLKMLPGMYAILGIPLNQFNHLTLRHFQRKFFALLYEKEGITLILRQDNWDKIKNNFRNLY